MRASWNRWLSALRKMAIARLAFPRWASVGNRANKVKGHATEDMVAGGRARKEHKDGNETADVAADFDTLCQLERTIDAEVEEGDWWYPRMLSRHWFMFAILRQLGWFCPGPHDIRDKAPGFESGSACGKYLVSLSLRSPSFFRFFLAFL